MKKWAFYVSEPWTRLTCGSQVQKTVESRVLLSSARRGDLRLGQGQAPLDSTLSTPLSDRYFTDKVRQGRSYLEEFSSSTCHKEQKERGFAS